MKNIEELPVYQSYLKAKQGNRAMKSFALLLLAVVSISAAYCIFEGFNTLGRADISQRLTNSN